MELKQPKDIINRKLFERLTPEQLSKEISKSVKKLNARMRRLEASGYAGASRSYGRMKNFLKDAYGAKRFSSKGTKNQSFNMNVETLVRLKHFEDYKINIKDVRKQIKSEIRALEENTGVQLTEEQLKTVNIAMEAYREATLRSTISEILPSDSAREFFTKYNDLDQNDIDVFIEEIKKFTTGELPEERLTIFIDNYNPNYRGAVDKTSSGIIFDPVTNQVYDEWHHKIDQYIDPLTDTITIDDKTYRYNEDGELYEVK